MARREWPYTKDGQQIRWEVTAEPATEPVTTAELKSQSRVDVSDDDTIIDTYIKAARLHVERVTGALLVTQTIKAYFDELPTSNYEFIELPVRPVSAVTAVEYVDTAGATQTWAGSNYTVDLKSFRPRIIPAYTVDWPDTREVVNAVTITCTAGYGAASSVPQNIKQAIILIAATWYENREDFTVAASFPIPHGASMLLGVDRNTIL